MSSVFFGCGRHHLAAGLQADDVVKQTCTLAGFGGRELGADEFFFLFLILELRPEITDGTGRGPNAMDLAKRAPGALLGEF